MGLFEKETDVAEVPGLPQEASGLFSGEGSIPFDEDDDNDGFGPLGETEPVAGSAPQPAAAPVAFVESDDFETDEEEIFAQPQPSAPPPRPVAVQAPVRPFAEPSRGLDFEPEDDFTEEDADLNEFSYANSDDDDDEEGVPQKSNLVLYAIFVLSGLFVLVMGYFAYNMFFASHGRPTAAVAQSIPMNTSPSQVPVHTLGAAPMAPQVIPTTASASVPMTIPDSTPATTVPSIQTAPAMAPVAAQPSMTMTVPADAAAAVQSPLVERHVEAPTSMISSDMKALSDRVAALESAKPDAVIADLQKTVADDHQQEEAYKAQIAALQASVDDLKAQMKSVSEKAASAAVKARAAVVAARAVKADAAASADTPPLKPSVLSGYQLRGVSQGGAHSSAWVDTGKGIVKVAAGDLIKGAGVVREVRETGNGWVVVTSKGIIVP